MSWFWYRCSSRDTRNSRSSLTSRKMRRSLNSFSAFASTFASYFSAALHPSGSNEHFSVPSSALVTRSTGAHATASMGNQVLR